MNKLVLAAGLVGLVAAGSVRADIAPPKGFKRLPVEHKITTDKEYPDYAFYSISGGDKATALKLDPKNPATITAGGGRYRFASLVAVPKDASKKYDSEKEFLAAVAKGNVEGLVKAKTNFGAFIEVKDTDLRKTGVLEYTLDKIDAKEGIVLTAKKDADKPKDPPPGEEDEGAVAAYTPRGGVWVAGLAGSLAVVFAGLWLVRRNR